MTQTMHEGADPPAGPPRRRTFRIVLIALALVAVVLPTEVGAAPSGFRPVTGSGALLGAFDVHGHELAWVEAVESGAKLHLTDLDTGADRVASILPTAKKPIGRTKYKPLVFLDDLPNIQSLM